MNNLDKRAGLVLKFLVENTSSLKSELNYNNAFQFLVAVILSAQNTDKGVNLVTEELFTKYKTLDDFVNADAKIFENDISSINFFRNKSKNILKTSKIVKDDFAGSVPKTIDELMSLPGIGYKTANVILGEVYGIYDGIAVDTHVRRLSRKFGLTFNINPDKIAKDLESVFDKKDWKYINHGLVMYGRYTCIARKHDCSKCQLTKIFQENNLSMF